MSVDINVINVISVLEVFIDNVSIEEGDLSGFKVDSCNITVDRPPFVSSLDMMLNGTM